MANCVYNGCNRQALYFMRWVDEDGQHEGYVCATHDKYLGRKNLVNAGLTVKEAIAFEKKSRTWLEKMK